MNKKGIRDAIFSSVDWDPSPTQEAVDRIDGFVTRALNQLSLEAPFLFFDSIFRFGTQAELASADSTDTILMAVFGDDSGAEANPWLFVSTFPVGTAGKTQWPVDRSQDGRKIIITDADGIEHKNQIRSVWIQESDGKGFFVDRFVISVMKPWPWSSWGVGPYTWRVFDDVYWFPDDMIELKAMRIVGQTWPGPIEVIGQAEAEAAGIVDDSTTSGGGGPMTLAYRRDHFALPGPNVAPALSSPTIDVEDPDPDDLWKGPEPAGQFEYCFTYTWGKRDVDHQNVGIAEWDTEGESYQEFDASVAIDQSAWGQNRMREPLFESAPSPAARITTEVVSVDDPMYPVIVVGLPHIEYQLGMGLAGQRTAAPITFERYTASHSGVHVRVYRRRMTEDYDAYAALDNIGGRIIDGLQKLDIHDDFYLLAEVRVDRFNNGEFIDDGSFLPDFNRPLRAVHGYQSIRFHPMPDARHEVEVRCVRKPRPLVSAQDVPPIHEEACELLIQYAKSLTYEMMKDYQSAQTSMIAYREQLDVLKRRYGDARPPNVPMRRHHASPAGYGRSNNTRWWKRSTNP